MNKRIFLRLATFSLCWSSMVLAQLSSSEDHLGPDFLQPQITAGFSSAATRNFQDIDGTFDVNSATLGAAIPVVRSLEGTIDNPTAYFALVRGQFSSVNEDVSFLPSPHIIYKSRIGITGGIATTNHHMYLLTIAEGFSEDRHTVGNARIRTTGSLLGKYQLEDSFAFIYGLSYSYTFNRGLVLPLLGTRCSLGSNLNLHVILPFSLDLDYEEAQELHFGFVVRANGDQIHIEDNSYLGPQAFPVFLKLAQLQAGFSVSFDLSDRIVLRGEAGILRNRSFAIGTLDMNLISSNIANAGYSSLVLKYVFGTFESWGD